MTVMVTDNQYGRLS